MKRGIIMRGMLLWGLMVVAGSTWALPGSLLRDEMPRLQPGGEATSGPMLAKGATVEILERRGGWARVAGAGAEGWVRVLSVRGEPAAQRDVLGETRAVLAGTEARVNPRIVAIAGFRGEEEADFAAGRRALETLAARRLAPGAADAFAAAAGLSRREQACAGGEKDSGGQVGGDVPKGVSLSLMTAWSLDRLGPEHEARIGAHLAARLLTALTPVADDALQAYVNRVGRWLADQAMEDATPWLFAVLEDEGLNAFALPGGYVFLTRGLYRRLADEAELAGTLAREMAKVRARAFIRALRATPLATAGRPRDEASFLAQLLGGGLTVLNRPLPPDSEFAADRQGVLLAARAGYDAYALAGVLQSLGAALASGSRAGLGGGGPPPPELRLARLDETLGRCLEGLPPGIAPNRIHRTGARD